jgi:hypothetical protein
VPDPLVDDLPRLWQASATSPRDKKRIIRLLVKDITIEKEPGLGPATLHVCWQGGACEDLLVRAPSAHRLRYPPEVLARIRALSADHSDEEIAALFNQEGLKTPRGRPFARRLVGLIRYHFKIPTHVDRRPGELSAQELADLLGIRPDVIYYWIQHGTLAVRQQRFHSRYWIPMDSAKEQELRAMVQASDRIRKSQELQPENRS